MLHRLLHDHTGRIVRLMEQLLDLSRLDGDVVRIERSRVTARPGRGARRLD
jgi:signal transduction histidine kinase